MKKFLLALAMIAILRLPDGSVIKGLVTDASSCRHFVSNPVCIVGINGQYYKTSWQNVVLIFGEEE